MALRRPKFVFDTQIASHVCNGLIPTNEWHRIKRFVSQRGRHAISAVTLYELIAGIAGGDERHFRENQQRLNLLSELAKTKYLALPRDFLRETVFGLNALKPEFGPQNLRLWVQVISKADSKRQVNGPVSIRGVEYGFDLSTIPNVIAKGKRDHSMQLQELREGKLRIPTTERWIASRLRECQVDTTPQNIAKLIARLDAPRQYDFFLFRLAKNHDYDFARHDSDWLDMIQLFYLADPLVHFVTLDTNIRRRTLGSSQSARILSFDEFKAKL
jgi:hypothetical protein